MADAPPNESRYADWRDVRRVLCVRLDAMGDVLMTTPALHAAKHSSRDRHVTLLTSPGGAAAARLVPDVDEVLVYESPWVKATAARRSSAPDHDLIRRLASLNFDAAVIFTVYSQNPLPAAMMCYLADIPRRLAHCHENPYQLLTDWVPDPEPVSVVRHEVRRQLDLVAGVGWRAEDERLRMAIPAPATASIEERLPCLGLRAGQPWAVLHPGASAPSRRYSSESYAAVVRTLTRTHGWHIVLTGTDSEADLLRQIQTAADPGAVSLAGSMTLPELGALLARAPLLISNNTGPVHVAAAMGTPVVDLYALTNPQHTPWQVPSRVLYNDVPCRCCYKSICPEGHHRCLDGVPPARVVAAALDLMRASAREKQALVSHAEIGGVPDPTHSFRRQDAASSRPPALPIAGSEADCARTEPAVVDERDDRRRAPAFTERAPASTEVDVLIPTWGRPAALAATLASLAAQTYRHLRVLISDQTEGAAAVRSGEVRAAARVLESHGCSVRLMQHLPRRGVAENRQHLLEQSNAPFVLCLDDDLILEPYVIEMLAGVLERERCGFAGSAVIGLSYVGELRPQEQHVSLWEGPVIPEEVLPGTDAWERFRLHNAANLYHVQRRLGASPSMPRLYKVAWVSGCVLYDSARLRDVGGFSFWTELPPAHCGEDVLAQLRVMKAYGGCGVMPSGVYHQELPTTVPQRDVEAPRALGWGSPAPTAAPAGSR